MKSLKDIKYIVTHANCPDGAASAILLYQVFPEAEYIFLMHGTREHRDLPVRPGTLFVDFSPVSEKVQEFVDAGAIILDHHATAKDIVAQFGENGYFGDEKTDPGVCGAVLAYRHIFVPLLGENPNYAELATLTGIRDTWQKDHSYWDTACEISSALMLYPWSYLAALSAENMMVRLDVGEWLYRKRLLSSKHLLSQSVEVVTAKGTCLVIAPDYYVSDMAELVDTSKLVIGFAFGTNEGTPCLRLSLRSRGDHDCAKICSFFGGGGHTKAAGCAVDITPETPQPFTHILGMIETYERQP